MFLRIERKIQNKRLAADFEACNRFPAFMEDDEGDEDENGVDFANMMRYNRSFIARIIQSPDEVKKYYGEI